MKSKQNIISEVSRIHKLMGVKKVVTEQVTASVSPLLKIIDDVLQIAATKNLDNTSKGLISKLSKGKKVTVDGKSQFVPLSDQEKIKTLSKLRDSNNLEIKNFVKSADDQITRAVENFIPSLTTSTKMKETILRLSQQLDKKAIKDGKILNPEIKGDLIEDRLNKFFEDEYGLYSRELMDNYGRNVRSTIDDVLDTPKPKPEKPIEPENVPSDDDLQQSFDNLGDDATTTTTDLTLPGSTNQLVDEVITDSVNSSRLATEELVDDNVAREFQDLNPSAYQRGINSFFSLIERVFVGSGMDGTDIRRRVIYNLERLQRVPPTDEGAILGKEIQKEIKAEMDMLRNMNRDYVEFVNQTIKNGKAVTNPNYDERIRWGDMETKLKEIQARYGDWGVLAVTSPNSGKYRTTKEALKAVFYLEGKISNLILNTKNFVSNIYGWVAKMNGKEVQNLPKPKIPLFVSQIVPGTPRGLPKKLESYDGKLLPNAYEEILRDSKRFPMFQAYYSLVKEKIIVVLKVEFISAFFIAAKNYWFFSNSEKEVIMKKYGPCVFILAEEMKKGNITIQGGLKNGAVMPKCFQDLIDAGTSDDILGKMLVRADFFSMGEGGSEYFGFIKRELFEKSVKEYIFKLFTGQFANYLYEGITEFFPLFYEAERTGNDNPFEEAAEILQSQTAPVLDSLDTRIEEVTTQVNRDSLNIPAVDDTTQTNVPISGRTSRNQQRNP